MSFDRFYRACRRHLSGLLILGLALAASGCGKKGDPLPPLRHVPATTQDLTVRQDGTWLMLDMGYPSATLSGFALGGIDAVELLQLVKPTLTDGALPTVEVYEFEASAQPLLTLRGTELTSAVTGDRIQFRLPLAEELPDEPAANVFGVRTIKNDETSAISNLTVIAPIAPPAPPSNLQITPRAHHIELTWEVAEGMASEGFDVFRREAQNRGYGDPLRRVAGEQREFRDRSALYGRRYIYTVRTVASAKPLIYSAAAGEREIEYEDRFAPPLPRSFVALGERASIRLRWDPSPAEDLAGYILFRREPGRDFHRLTEDPITAVEYLDRGLTTGFSYDYRIQVVDRQGNASELSRPVTSAAR